MGKIKSLNKEQDLAFDLLNDKQTTVKLLTGRFGSGKTMLMTAAAIARLDKGEVDHLIYIRNNVQVKDAPDIGYLPGDKIDKLIDYAMPLADALGGTEGLLAYLANGKIEIQPLGLVRGRDFKNSIIFCSECENPTKDHVQLLLGRVGEGSSIWFDGDRKRVDKATFDKNSGMDRLIDRLKGNKLFGYVQLQKPREAKPQLSQIYELDEKYTSVILRRYVEDGGNPDDVYVERNGEKLMYSDMVKQVEGENE